MSNISVMLFVRTVLLVCALIPSLVICYRAGTPGIDYPNYLRAPRTGFTCKGRGNGYFSDPEAGCQAYHVCDNGRKYSFVCPVSTLFSDSVKTCDYWYNVRCSGRDNEGEQPDRPDIEQPEPVVETEQPDNDIERPVEVDNEPDSNPEPSDGSPITNPDNEPSDDRTSTGPSISPSPPENTGEPDEAEPDRENEAPEDESPESGPDVVPGSVPDDWRRSGGAGRSNQWTTYPTTMKDAMTTGPTKWKTYSTSTRSVDSEPTSATDDNVISESDKTTKTSRDATSSTTSNPGSTSSSDAESDEFREENWIEQGMPSPANESDNDNLIEGGSGSNATQDAVANVSRYSGEGRRRHQSAASDANESGLIGSMMKWAAAANSALSLRQAEPKVTQTNGGTTYSEPKGPNPYIPFEERQRRARDPHVSHQTDSTVTNPSPSSASSPNPPYTYPYEPSLNPSMANSGMHVSLNERKVYARDSSRKSGEDNKRSAPSESADHPNPWTFPMTDQETAEAAAKPRDTYRSRRRDDPFDVSHRKKTNAKTGSAFDMMMATTTTTTATSTSPKTTPESTTASYVSGVTESLTTQTKSGTQSKKPGNFMTGEVMPNGQCRCPLPKSDVYVS